MCIDQKNKIIVVCPTYWDYYFLCRSPWQSLYHFVFAKGADDLSNFDAWNFIRRLTSEHADNVAGVVATHDYPASLLAVAVAQNLQLTASDPGKVLLLQHKYYCRLLQMEIVPHATPKFMHVPISAKKLATEDLTLPFPFFIKPVKGLFSFLTQKIHSVLQLQEFLCQASDKLQQFVGPFNQLWHHYMDLPLDGNCFIAEQILSGTQVTVEGYVENGNVHIIGIVDSVMYPGTSSFQRFEYPSKLSRQVQIRMQEVVQLFIKHSQYNHGMFNVELFYDQQTDRIAILELNTRMSSIFADLFAKVDGNSNYDVLLHLAMKVPVVYRKQEGSYRVAAAFILRTFADKTVIAISGTEEIAALQQQFPDMHLKIEFAPGEKLSSIIQSSGSYKYATLHLGAATWEALYQKFAIIESRLHFEFD